MEFSACQNTKISQSMSPTAAVRAIFQTAGNYIKHVEKIGKAIRKYRNTTQWNCQQRRRSRVVSAQERGYFNKVNHLRNVYTLKFQTAKHQLVPCLAQTYYDYSSNNCTDIVNKANPGNINVESTQCIDSIEETLDGVPLQDKDIRVGLPPQTEASHDNVTWAFLHVIQNAAIDYKGNIFIADGRLEPFQCYRKWQPRCDNDEIKKMRYYDEVFTIKSLWSSYYHVTIDQFARLVFYKEFLAANPHIILHCSKPHPFLDILGLRGIQVASGNISARIVYAPGAMPCGMASLFQTQLLSAVLRSRLPVDVSRRNVVLIKRSTRRCFTHHSDILAMLEKHSADVGLAVSVFSDNPLPSVEETRIMFHNAIIVVAPHGAGEANIILCSPRTVLIEGLCRDGDNRLTLCYRNLARVLGMHYHGLVPRNQCMDTTASDIEAPFLQFLHLYTKGRL